MIRKIFVFTHLNVENAYIMDFRDKRDVYKDYPNVYIFLRGRREYNRIKKGCSWQTASLIKN